MGKPRSRCCGMYRPTWDKVERCELPEKHKGPHGPLPVPQVTPPAPLLTVRKPALAQEHSETSKDAARKIEAVRGEKRQRVLAYLLDYGPATDQEGAAALGMDPSTYRPRRIELEEANLIRKTDRTRATKSGRKAAVYEAVR